MTPLLEPGVRLRGSAIVTLVWVVELFTAWFTSRPVVAFVESFGLERGELFEPGSVMLLEILRLGRIQWAALGWLTLESVFIGLLLVLPARALLLLFCLEPGAKPDSLALSTVRLVPKLAAHHVTLGLLFALAATGLIFASAPLADVLTEGEFSSVWFLLAVPLFFLGGNWLRLLGDIWALQLGRNQPLFRAFTQACAASAQLRWTLLRSVKSVVVILVGALGFVATRDTAQGSVWFSWCSVRLLGWTLVAVDLAWYRLLAPLSAGRPRPAGRAADGDVPVGPTPDLGA